MRKLVCRKSGDENHIDSVILLWDDGTRRFRERQRITTTGAYDWTYFSVDIYHFLAVANAFNGLTTLIDSEIYLYHEGSFIEFQTMEVSYNILK